jgi:subtilisin family serine protease
MRKSLDFALSHYITLLIVTIILAHANSASAQNIPDRIQNVATDRYIIISKSSSRLNSLTAAEAPSLNRSGSLRFSNQKKELFAIERSEIKTILAKHGQPQNKVDDKTVSSLIGATFAGKINDSSKQELEEKGYTVRHQRIYKLLLNDSVPLIKADTVWSPSGYNVTGRGVKVGVIDSGIDYTNSLFGSCTENQFANRSCLKVRGGHDFVDDDPNPNDTLGHGTHVAGIIAGNGQLKGVAPEAELWAYRVCADSGCYEEAIIKAIERSVDPNQDGNTSDHLDVINLSLGGAGDPDDPISQAVDAAVSAGVVVVCSAGNSGPSDNTIGSPGTARNAITVAASHPRQVPANSTVSPGYAVDQVADFSSRGPVDWESTTRGSYSILKPDITAPGVRICSARSRTSTITDRDCLAPDLVALSGTSMAAPHIAGVAALLKQSHPSWSPTEIKNALKSSAKTLTDPLTNAPYPTTVQGAGRVDALLAIGAVSTTNPPEAFLSSVAILRGLSIPIYGTVTGDDFLSYTLEFKPSAATTWTTFAAGTSQVRDNKLGNLDTSTLASGRYQLRLTANYNSQSRIDLRSFSLRNVELTSPYYLDSFDGPTLLGPNSILELTGTVIGGNVSSYKFEWCTGPNSTVCSSSGFTLENEGKLQINNGLLGRWNPAQALNIKTSDITIKLIVNYTNHESTTFTADVHYDSEIAKGFPIKHKYRKLYPSGRPVLADIDSDGKKDLIYPNANKLHVVNNAGIELPGWPRTFNAGTINFPLIADFDRDGHLEIAGTNSGEDLFYIIKYDGNDLNGWPKDNNNLGLLHSMHYYNAAIGDANSDGITDLIFKNGLNGATFALNAAGDRIANFPQFVVDGSGYINSQVEPAASTADLNGDGLNELIVAAEYGVSIIDHSGMVMQGWPKKINGNQDLYTVVIADLNSDGNADILTRKIVNSSVEISAFNYKGQNLPGWPLHLPSEQTTGPENFHTERRDALSVGDLNNDGKLEVVIPIRGQNSCLWVADSQGQILNGWPQCASSSSGNFGENATIANLDNDSENEILITVDVPYNQIIAFNRDGSLVSGFPKKLASNSAAPGCIAGDMNGDNKQEIVCEDGEGITAWSLYACSNKVEEWSLYLHDAMASRSYKAPNASKCAPLPALSSPTATPVSTPTETPTAASPSPIACVKGTCCYDQAFCTKIARISELLKNLEKSISRLKPGGTKTKQFSSPLTIIKKLRNTFKARSAFGKNFLSGTTNLERRIRTLKDTKVQKDFTRNKKSLLNAIKKLAANFNNKFGLS